MILLDHKEYVAGWVCKRLRGAEMPAADGRWFEALGFLDAREQLCGGVVYYDYFGHDITAVAAGEGQWLTPLKTKAIFLYPFAQLGCRRMSVSAARKNKRSRRFIERLGFRLEGVKRKGLPDGQDEMLYGMLKSECRWLDIRTDHEENAKAA